MKPNHHLVKVNDIWYFRAEVNKKVIKFSLDTTNLKGAPTPDSRCSHLEGKNKE